jgi:type IV secretory pathway VirB10-like protein
MMPITHMSLPRPPPPTIIQPRVKHVTFLALCLLAHGALAQQQSNSKPESKQGQDDLDVTMQIIVDPDAKLPDEVVRRIPLPERKPVDSPASKGDKKASKEAAADSKQSAREAKEVAKEASQSAKEEAAEQREQARRARAEERERERNRPHPPGNPNPPGRPPR